MAALVTEKKLINLPLSANMYTAGDINQLLENKVDKKEGKRLSTNDYTNTDKNKLDNIQAGAEVNQNAFSKIKVGSTTIDSGSKTDTLELSAGNNVVLTTDSAARKIVIHSLGGGGGRCSAGRLESDRSRSVGLYQKQTYDFPAGSAPTRRNRY